jgi:hypothetical protein
MAAVCNPTQLANVLGLLTDESVDTMTMEQLCKKLNGVFPSTDFVKVRKKILFVSLITRGLLRYAALRYAALRSAF